MNSVFSQDLKKNELLIPYRDGNSFGLCDTLGIVKIQPFAEEITDFKINEDFSGKYIFKVNNRQKVINDKGNVLLENKEYDSISIVYFKYGIEIYKKKKVGVFLNGKEFIPCQYDRIQEVQNGSYEVFQNNKSGLINSSGDLIIPVKYYSIDVSEDMTDKSKTFIWTTSDKSGRKKEYSDAKITLDKEFSHAELSETFVEIPNHKITNDFRNNLFEIQKKYGYIRDIIENRLAIVQVSEVSERNRKVGVMNIINKNWVIHPEYNAIAYITNEHGKAIFELEKNHKYNFADEDLKQILPDDFDDSIKYNENIYLIKKDDKWGAKIFHTVYPYIPMKYKSINLTKTIKINDDWTFTIFEIELENGKKGYIGENGIEYFRN